MPVGSIVELNTTVARDVTREEVLAAYRAAAEGPLNGHPGVLGRTPRLQRHHRAARVVDLRCALTRVDGRHVKVVAWYDNEWGFSNRVVDTLELLAR